MTGQVSAGNSPERGSGTLLVAAAALVAGVVITAVVVLVAFLAASHRVRAVADLVAVSAATEYGIGGPACRTAARIAAANQVVLRRCVLRGDLVDFAVTVEVTGRAPAAWLPEPTATSHAGRVVDQGRAAGGAGAPRAGRAERGTR